MPDINILWHEGGRPPIVVMFTLRGILAYVNFFSASQSASEIWKCLSGGFIARMLTTIIWFSSFHGFQTRPRINQLKTVIKNADQLTKTGDTPEWKAFKEAYSKEKEDAKRSGDTFTWPKVEIIYNEIR